MVGSKQLDSVGVGGLKLVHKSEDVYLSQIISNLEFIFVRPFNLEKRYI